MEYEVWIKICIAFLLRYNVYSISLIEECVLIFSVEWLIQINYMKIRNKFQNILASFAFVKSNYLMVLLFYF